MRTSALALLAAAVLAGCSSSGTPDASPQPQSPGTGSIAVVASGQTHKIYVPAPLSPTNPKANLAVLDGAAPHLGNGFIRFVDLGVTGRARGVGASGVDVVAFSESSPTLVFVDGATDAIRGTAQLPVGATQLPSSDDLSYSLGVAVDALGRRVYASSSFGILQYHLDSRALLQTFAVPPPENFSLDAARGRIYSPFYLCDPTFPEGANACTAFVEPAGPDLTDSFEIVDLATAKRYQYRDAAAAGTRYPLGLQPDAMAVDFGLNMAAVAIEEPATIQLFDLAAITFDETTSPGTCGGTAFTVAMPFDQMTALAIDQTTHLLAIGRELREEIGFVDLAKAKQGISSMITATMPALPGGVPWSFHADPHGVTVGIIAGKPYVFALNDDNTYVARIDLTAVQALMAGSGTFASAVSLLAVPVPQ